MSDSAEDPFDWVGATLEGKYQVDALVGRGGFGVVYRAHHLGFDERVAVKCLRIPQTLSGRARDEFERTFLAEGRLLHQLSRSTAGIVQALDVGAAVSPNKTWTPFIVLEWLDGKTLDEDFRQRRASGQGGRTLEASLELLDGAARALALAHEQGIAHRDIKPQNLFVAEVAGRRTLKVLDFGIAKVVSESESFSQAFEETGASLQAFTARYGAPEQFSRRYGATGPWSDVFSLALVLVEAVVGRSALQGDDSAQLFIAAADTAHRPTLRAHGVPASEAVEAVLRTALAVDPKQRYADAGKFWEALRAAADDAQPRTAVADRNVPEQPSSDASRVTRLDVTVADPSRESAASPKTELTASTADESATAAGHEPGQRWQRWLAASVLLSILVGGLALYVARAPTFTAESVAKAHGGAAAVSLAPSTPALPAVPSASSASEGFAGLPARDVPPGSVAPNGAWLDKFGILRRRNNQGLDLTQAFAQCADVGKTLCTESQWQRACQAYPEVADTPSWTETSDGAQMVVRGGGSCDARRLVSAADRDTRRTGLCCDRAIAMSSTSLQKPFLTSTANVVLELERSLNQRSVERFLKLSEEHVAIDDHPRDQAALKALLRQSFASARDLVVVNDQCDISVAAKKVIKRSRRSKTTHYETTGWSAECQQTRHRDGKVLRAKSRYEFSAASKLRAIFDRELPSSSE